ncbi:hypothetical protein BTVI_76558 [Pitangus sulphuratus]|nr:hypothetical protein BTVI_76558 [Pitangus sulphuratus]
MGAGKNPGFMAKRKAQGQGVQSVRPRGFEKKKNADRKRDLKNDGLDSRNVQHIFGALLAHYPTNKNCAGCGRDIKNGQALLALDKQWHLGCFKCKACGKVLTGEYISKDGAPYCEKDYQVLFGVKCEACHQFITGKVLEELKPTSNATYSEFMEMKIIKEKVIGICGKLGKNKPLVRSQKPAEKETMEFDVALNIKQGRRFCDLCKQVTSIIIQAVHDAAGATKCSQKEKKCTCKIVYSGAKSDTLKSVGVYFDDFDKCFILLTQRKAAANRWHYEKLYFLSFKKKNNDTKNVPGLLVEGAKVDNEILDYKDLAAIPKVKAIYDIERPDLITYEPFYTSAYEDRQERQSLGEGYQDVRDRMIHRSTSQGSINSPVYSRHSYTPTMSRSPQHFHRPGNHKLEIIQSSFRKVVAMNLQEMLIDLNISKEDLCMDTDYYIAKFPDCHLDAAALAAQSKSSEDIIKSSKFPAAHAPAPNEIPKIETDHWPGPPSLAAIGMRKQTVQRCGLKGTGNQSRLIVELKKWLNSGLGQLILKEEMEKESRGRSALSASRYDSPAHASASKTSSLPGYGKNGLHRPVSTDFGQYNSYGDVSGAVRDFQVEYGFSSIN